MKGTGFAALAAQVQASSDEIKTGLQSLFALQINGLGHLPPGAWVYADPKRSGCSAICALTCTRYLLSGYWRLVDDKLLRDHFGAMLTAIEANDWSVVVFCLAVLPLIRWLVCHEAK